MSWEVGEGFMEEVRLKWNLTDLVGFGRTKQSKDNSDYKSLEGARDSREAGEELGGHSHGMSNAR